MESSGSRPPPTGRWKGFPPQFQSSRRETLTWTPGAAHRRPAVRRRSGNKSRASASAPAPSSNPAPHLTLPSPPPLGTGVARRCVRSVEEIKEESNVLNLVANSVCEHPKGGRRERKSLSQRRTGNTRWRCRTAAASQGAGRVDVTIPAGSPVDLPSSQSIQSVSTAKCVVKSKRLFLLPGGLL